jgi:hypothetical protein
MMMMIKQQHRAALLLVCIVEIVEQLAVPKCLGSMLHASLIPLSTGRTMRAKLSSE